MTSPTLFDHGSALHGLMMDTQLTVPLLLDRMKTVHSQSTVSTARTAGADPDVTTVSFGEIVERAKRLAQALADLGVEQGDRIGTFGWNTQEHMEIYYAVTGSGAVLHTVNIRLHAEQIAYTINHAEDTVLFVDAALREQFEAVRDRLTSVQTVIVFNGPSGHDLEYESLVRSSGSGFIWPSLDERTAANLCYTSGTTGDPKGILYSHRSIVLHALTMAGTDVFRLAERDVVLALVPLFHVMGWGLPFICGVTGSSIVLPGPHLDATTISALISRHGVTWSGGVPTLWMDVANEIDRRSETEDPVDVSSLQTLVCGGTAVPETLMRRFADLDVQMVQGWGMTEAFPGAAMVPPAAFAATAEQTLRSTAGRISPLYQMRVLNEHGDALPRDGQSVGELQVRGPMVASQYLGRPPTNDHFIDGWLRTGDMGSIDPRGYVRITDRLKDAIKSGGEWISSLDLESAIMAHPLVCEAAVIGRPDERWSERPVAFVVVRTPIEVHELEKFLTSRVERWWIPDEFVFVDDIPRNSTGKFDKKLLRKQLATAGGIA